MKKITLLFSLLLCFVTSAQNNITFSVDMAGQSFTQAYVSGSFNSWSGDSNPLTDMGGGIWEVTLPIPDGEYEFKFTFDNWTGQEAFTQGDVCTITNYGNTNRRLVVAGADQTLATALFGVCAESSDGNNGPHNVTFNVDMSGAPAFTTAYVSGEFNSWSGDANALSDMGGGIYSTTLPLNEASYQFKVTTDNWTQQEGFAPGDAGTSTDGTFTNRYIAVNGDKTLDFAWNVAKVLNVKTLNSVTNYSVYPNPAKNSWTIKSDSQIIIKTIQVFDVLGKQVMTLTPKTNEMSIDASTLPNGLYFAKMTTDLGSGSIKLIKN